MWWGGRLEGSEIWRKRRLFERKEVYDVKREIDFDEWWEEGVVDV